MTAIREDGPIVSAKASHNECDMAIFVYDDSRTSFEWCAPAGQIPPHIPIMYVALNKTFRKAVHAVASTSNNDGGTNGSAELDNRGMEHDSAVLIPKIRWNGWWDSCCSVCTKGT